MIGWKIRDNFAFNPMATPIGTVHNVPSATAIITRPNVSPDNLPMFNQSPMLNCINKPKMLTTPQATPANVAAATSQPSTLRQLLPELETGATAAAAEGAGVAKATSGI